MTTRKTVFFTLMLYTLGSVAALSAECVYMPDKDGFGFSFTAYGAPDKSYVVSQNTFKVYTLASPNGTLRGATIDIDATSLDTSADLSNGMGGYWAPGIAQLRDMNVVNGLFKQFANPGKIHAKVDSISGDRLSLLVTMNEVTAPVEMVLEEKDSMLHARGSFDLLEDFQADSAFAALEQICTIAWHKGKSWSDVDIEFHVPVQKDCS
ncbi:MAG TPA: hypothetical protein DD979_13550 [Gammaproteobacteria bacterium]|nr:hypothetical protein [Gammaproteobacteria bacterium]